MLFKSAILRLTIVYVVIIMVISIGFSAVLYSLYSREFGQGLGRQTRILRDIPVSCNVPLPWPVQDLEKVKNEQAELGNYHLRVDLVYFNALILLLSAVFSYFFARRTLEPIEEMVLSQKRFTADASHELKTPLTAMKTEIEVNIRDSKLTKEDAVKLLKSNLEEIAKLETLSNALLNLAKYQKEERAEFKPLSLSDVIASSFGKVESMAKKKSIEFINKVPDITLVGDDKSLQELFVILFDNAIKYSPTKTKVHLSSQKSDGKVTVEVRDEGQGIAKEDLEHIFDRFYRVDASRNKEKTSGYGLGLSIAESIAKLHGGEISAKSELGKGSTFAVVLPIKKKV